MSRIGAGLPMPVFTTALSVHEVALNGIHACGAEADWRDWRGTGARLLAQAADGRVRLAATKAIGFDAIPAALMDLRNGRNEAKLVATP